MDIKLLKCLFSCAKLQGRTRNSLFFHSHYIIVILHNLAYSSSCATLAISSQEMVWSNDCGEVEDIQINVDAIYEACVYLCTSFKLDLLFVNSNISFTWGKTTVQIYVIVQGLITCLFLRVTLDGEKKLKDCCWWWQIRHLILLLIANWQA